jgi:hypothetical protein
MPLPGISLWVATLSSTGDAVLRETLRGKHLLHHPGFRRVIITMLLEEVQSHSQSYVDKSRGSGDGTMNTVDDVIESERSSEKNLPQQGRTTKMRDDTRRAWQ